ncbi:hypothetical protein KW790_02890 [Candidatus Parcubacteria bacterium]|nr:hypothetical protein [Candidatus Parcubacteria bacterium]
MSEKLKNLCIRLENRIASAMSLSTHLVSEEVRITHEELKRIVRIFDDPNAAMNKYTIESAGTRAERALNELCNLERRYLVSASVAAELSIRISKIEVRKLETWKSFRAWRSLAAKVSGNASTLEIREVYMNFLGMLSTAENESITARIRSVTVPPPPVTKAKSRHRRSLYDAELRKEMRGNSPPADKQGHGKRAKVKA